MNQSKIKDILGLSVRSGSEVSREFGMPLVESDRQSPSIGSPSATKILEFSSGDKSLKISINF